ncbi:hypothetical protein P4311_27315 [Bacillus thuringiensis]|nr:hypothetical protein [Bacillus thuringiensis]
MDELEGLEFVRAFRATDGAFFEVGMVWFMLDSRISQAVKRNSTILSIMQEMK